MIAQSDFIEAYGASIYGCLMCIVLIVYWFCEGCQVKLKKENLTEPMCERFKSACFSLIRTFFATLFILMAFVSSLYFFHSKYELVYPQELLEALVITICMGILAPVITISFYLIIGPILNLCHNHLQHRRNLHD